MTANGWCTSAKVSVDTHVAGRSTQTLLFSIRYMLFGLWIPVLLGHTKVDNVDHVLFAGCTTHEKVIGFDIAIDEVLFVKCLNSGDLSDDKR